MSWNLTSAQIQEVTNQRGAGDVVPVGMDGNFSLHTIIAGIFR